jgi:YegS/Rv2252/BmrU family lipid kinase
MSSPEIVVILNPAAGGGKTLKSLPRIHGILKRLGRSYAIYLTKERGDAITAARNYAEQGAKRIIAAGGDGTINEVANGIYESGQRPIMAVVPAGHGSDFARTLELPKSVEQSVLNACEHEPHDVDLGLATYEDGSTRAFINIAGLGFDALVAEKAQTSRLPGANLPYLGSALKTLVSFKNIGVHISVDGETLDTPAVFVQIANARYMGGGYHFAPMAKYDDGLLDLCLVGNFAKTELIRAIPSCYKGTHVKLEKFTHRSGKTISVTTDSPAKVQLDGEILGTTPVTFTVLPGAISFAK